MKKGKLFLLLSLLGLVVPAVASTASFSTFAEEDTATDTTDTGYGDTDTDPGYGDTDTGYGDTDTGYGDTDTSTDTGTTDTGDTDPGEDPGEDPSEDVPFELTYEETNEWYDIYRYYNGYGLGHINENFRAPSGCVLTMEADWGYCIDVREQVMEHQYFKDKETVNFISMCAYRNINGSKMYSDLICDWNIRVIDIENFICDNIGSLNLYEINEKIADVDVSATIEVELCTKIEEFEWAVYLRLYFNIQPYQVKKSKPGDILHLYTSNYGDRVNIRADLDENLFNEKYGFKTDGREPYSWDETQYWENYLVQYIDRDTNIILDTDDAHDTTPGIEINGGFPDTPINMYAVLTFKSGGVEYKFYSNDLTIEYPVLGMLIDGYDNRTTIGAGTQHTLSFNISTPIEDITVAWLYVWLQGVGKDVCNNVYDPEMFGGSEMSVRSSTYKRYNIMTEDFWKFSFGYKDAGDYEFAVEMKICTENSSFTYSFIQPITITEKQEEYTPIDQALTLNYKEERIDVVAGGDPITLEAAIAEDALKIDEVPTFEWATSRINVVDMKVENNKAVITPIGSGVVNVEVTCYGEAFGMVCKSIIFNVISDVYSITSLTVPNEFHYSGDDITVGLKIDKYSSLANFTPEWKVTNLAGEEVEFKDNKNCSITLENPSQDDYTVTALYNGVEIDSQVIEVRNVNVDQLIQKNIIWLVLITLAFMAAVIVLKSLLEKQHSLVEKIEKTNKKFESLDRNSATIVKDLGKVRNSILYDIDYARSLNMTALNEYEKTIRYLGKSLASIKDITKNKPRMTDAEFEEKYVQLAKDLHKAYIVAKEIDDAKDVARTNSLKANENNITKIENHDKKKKKKEIK